MSSKKILIFNPFGIGDVLFTTPLVKCLREQMPKSTIIYICNRRAYPILKDSPLIDKIFIFEKDEWKAIAKVSRLRLAQHAFFFFRKIRKEKIDVLFDFSLNSRYGFFLKMIGIKKRIGPNFKNRGRFLTHKVDIPRGYSDKHVAQYCLELLKFLDITPQDHKFQLFLDEEEIEKAQYLLMQHNLSKDDNLVVVAPASGDSWGEMANYKRWPEGNFIQLCDKLMNELNAKIIIVGSKSEMDICGMVYTSMANKAINLAGKLNLIEFSAILSLCKLVITNDGGPFHIAQALNKKIVVFFGPQDEQVYGVYPDQKNSKILSSNIECRPCYQKFKFTGCDHNKKCLSSISVDTAFNAAKDLLSTSENK